MYVGCHIDNVIAEMKQAKVNKLTIVDCFREVLDGLNIVLYQHAPKLNHKYDQDCQCKEYIQQHMAWVLTMEQDLQTYLGRDIMTNTQACWFTQTSDKYNLLHQLYVRKL